MKSLRPAIIYALLKVLPRLCTSAGLLLLVAIAAPSLYADEGEPFLDSTGKDKYAVILVGATATDEMADRFGGWALDLRESLQEDYGYDTRNLRLLAGAADEDDFNVDGASRAETIRATFETLAKEIKPGDQLTIFLIGHGTASGKLAKYNIVGPDLSGSDFADILEQINTQNIAVINTTSASYGFSKALSANGRVIVSATRSSAEKYDTVFPRYFIEGLQGQAADRDKNGRVSILEAFNYARARVDAYFDERGSLPSEHATLDDNGDGVFSVKPDQRGDGRLAQIAYFDVAGSASNKLTPAAAQLRGRMSELERDVFLLRANKSSLAESEYWAQLEPLLIELAKVSREFDELSTP